jgi:hypothetical protein
MVAFFEDNLGPVVALKSILPGEKYDEMTGSIKEVIGQFDQGRGDVIIDSEYLLVIAQKS